MAPTSSPSMIPAASIPSPQPGSQAPGSSLLPFEAWLHIRDSLRLSDRELQIVQSVFDDEQPSVAENLAMSPDTLYRAIQRIYVKLHVGSRAELIVRVMSEYLAFVADQEQPEISGLPFWSLKFERFGSPNLAPSDYPTQIAVGGVAGNQGMLTVSK